MSLNDHCATCSFCFLKVPVHLGSVLSEDASASTMFSFNEPSNSFLNFSRKFGSQNDNSLIQTSLSVCEENPPTHHISHTSRSTGSPSYSNLCQNFAFPPPPPGDRRRPGPRRKFKQVVTEFIADLTTL